MLSRVIAKNVGDVFFETQCSMPRVIARRTMYLMEKNSFLSGTGFCLFC